MAANSIIEHVDSSWNELRKLVEGLSPTQLKLPSGEWAIKDHLVHVAAWEQSLLALIEGRDRQVAMGVSEADHETDAINEAVFTLHHNDAPDQVLADFRKSHEKLIAALRTLSDADLQRPYSHYQPDTPDETRPVIAWVGGNTFEHYDEHAGWIKKDLSTQRR